MAEFTEFPLDFPQAEAPKQPETTEQPEKGRQKRAREGAELNRGRIDLTFLLLTLLLLGVGMVMMLSASYVSAYYDTVGPDSPGQPLYYFRRQVIMAILGLALMVILSKLPYGLLRWPLLPYIALAAAFGLLVLVTVIGKASHGAVRWVQIAGIRFQPSELLKAALVFFFAEWGSRHADKMGTFRYGAAPHLIIMAFFAVLLMLQPHLSATMIVVGITLIMMWASGTRWYYVIGCIVLMWLLYLFVMANRQWLLEDLKIEKLSISLPGSMPGRIPQAWDGTTAGRSSNPCMPSAPEACWALAWARAARNTCICPKSITTISFPSSARSWALSARC